MVQKLANYKMNTKKIIIRGCLDYNYSTLWYKHNIVSSHSLGFLLFPGFPFFKLKGSDSDCRKFAIYIYMIR